MYMGGIDCGCSNKPAGLRGLALGWDTLFTGLVGSAMGSGGGGGAGGGGAAPGPYTSVNTSTSVNTQVSPQISPNFIQQQQPTNSAVNASTSMTPVTGAIPGIDTAVPYYPSSVQSSGVDMRIVALGAAGALLIVLLAMRHKKGNKHVS